MLALLRERNSEERMVTNGKRNIGREERWTRGERAYHSGRGKIFSRWWGPATDLRPAASAREHYFVSSCLLSFLAASFFIYPLPSYSASSFHLVFRRRLRRPFPIFTQRLLSNLRSLLFIHSLGTPHSTDGWAVAWKTATRPILLARQ